MKRKPTLTMLYIWRSSSPHVLLLPCTVISLTNLTIEPSTFTKDTETATVFWVLENAGFPPITHFEIQWKDVPPAELIDESTFTDLGFLGTFPPENTANISLYHSPSLEGTRFNHTIHVQDKTRYVIYVRALNDDETNIGYIFFVFDTSGNYPSALVQLP